MKAKIILYGWMVSILLMIGGLGSMEWAMETGEPVFLQGLLMFLVFLVFSGLVILYQEETDEEMERLEKWMDRVAKNINNWFEGLI